MPALTVDIWGRPNSVLMTARMLPPNPGTAESRRPDARSTSSRVAWAVRPVRRRTARRPARSRPS